MEALLRMSQEKEPHERTSSEERLAQQAIEEHAGTVQIPSIAQLLQPLRIPKLSGCPHIPILQQQTLKIRYTFNDATLYVRFVPRIICR